jgi:3-oxoacyl-[acyl-carrier protein] reductase
VRGIGRGIANRLFNDGARVVVWDRDTTTFDPGAAGFSPTLVQQVDVTDLSAVERAVSAVNERLGSVGILVNNAGINGPVHPTWEYPPDDWNRVIAIDLTGVFNCCRAVVPTMRDAGYGRIVNVASIAGKEGGPGIVAYAAAKGGVIALTKSLAKELAPSNVLVNAIAPVITETDLFREMTADHISAMKAKIPMARFLKIEEIAAMVAWIASPQCSFTTGATFDLSGGRATY